MSKVLYIAWQNPKDRRWFPVAQLSSDGSTYRFVYTRGAEEAPGFLPFGRMRDLHSVYESTEMFPLFANRLLSKERPEYQDFLRWLAVPAEEADPLALLERTGGSRETDSLIVFTRPQKTSTGRYEIKFFVQGLRYLPSQAIEVVNRLLPGTRLFLMPDPQNPHDASAVALRTEDPKALVGYCPRYLAEDFAALLEKNGPKEIVAAVEQVNQSAPIQLRLLCQISAPWPEDFRPCGGDLYEPLASSVQREVAAS